MPRDYLKLAASLVFPSISADKYQIPDLAESYRRLVKMGVRGFCVFQGGLSETSSMLNDLRAIADSELLFCADFEHGLPMRLVGGTDFPHAMAMSKTGSSAMTLAASSVIAQQARELGITWNLAPVADINSNPNNPIIGIRAFGSHIDEAWPHIQSYIQGHQGHNVLACVKHFPGHGDTDVDSHQAMPVLSKTLEELEAQELEPFRRAIAVGVKSVMIGHLGLAFTSRPDLPASLNQEAVRGLLREKLAFDGLVVSDALDMKAVADRWSSGESAVLALRAGIDVLLVPKDPFQAIEHLARALESDRDLARLAEEASKRIAEHRTWSQAPRDKVQWSVSEQEFFRHQKLALDIAGASIRYSGAQELALEEQAHFAAFALCLDEQEKGTAFFNFMAQASEANCDFGYLDSTISNEELLDICASLDGVRRVVLVVFSRARAYKVHVDIAALVNRIAEAFTRVAPVTIAFCGNGEVRGAFESSGVVRTYSDSLASIGTLVQALSGRITVASV